MHDGEAGDQSAADEHLQVGASWKDRGRHSSVHVRHPLVFRSLLFCSQSHTHIVITMVCRENADIPEAQFTEQVKNSTVILVDVAGTTTEIAFIKKTLFPYVVSNVKSHLEEHWDAEEIKTVLNVLREECADLPKDGDKNKQIEKFVEHIKSETEQNKDSVGLKQIQGLIFQGGYASGDLKGHVFDDVAPALQSWAESGKRRVCVYSTGSIESQKLLFGKSAAGDLTAHITKHFDQGVGLKTESSSYVNIAKQLECVPETIVFLTDSIDEASAASKAGINVVLVSREGNAPISEEQRKLFPVVKSFAELPLNDVLELASKRKCPIDEGVTESRPSKIAKTTIENVGEKVEGVKDALTESKDSAEAVSDKNKTGDNHTTEAEKTEKTKDVTATAETSQKSEVEKMEADVEPAPKTSTPAPAESTTDEVEAMEVDEEAVVDKKVAATSEATPSAVVEAAVEIDDKDVKMKEISEPIPDTPSNTDKKESAEIKKKTDTEEVNKKNEVSPTAAINEKSETECAKTEINNETDKIKNATPENETKVSIDISESATTEKFPEKCDDKSEKETKKVEIDQKKETNEVVVEQSDKKETKKSETKETNEAEQSDKKNTIEIEKIEIKEKNKIEESEKKKTNEVVASEKKETNEVEQSEKKPTETCDVVRTEKKETKESVEPVKFDVESKEVKIDAESVNQTPSSSTATVTSDPSDLKVTKKEDTKSTDESKETHVSSTEATPMEAKDAKETATESKAADAEATPAVTESTDPTKETKVGNKESIAVEEKQASIASSSTEEVAPAASADVNGDKPKAKTETTETKTEEECPKTNGANGVVKDSAVSNGADTTADASIKVKSVTEVAQTELSSSSSPEVVTNGDTSKAD